MKRRIGLGLTIVGLIVMMLPLTAQAHNFQGEGDCDGWTLHLDGIWGASAIYVDGVSIGLEQNPVIADTSDITERTFVVLWDKPESADVTVTHTVTRVLDCEELPPTYDCVNGQVIEILPDEDGYPGPYTTPEEAQAAPGCVTTTTEATTTTTTTLPEETTTTEATTSTTSLFETGWNVVAECLDLTATEMGEGIIQLDLYQRLPGDGPTGGDFLVDHFTFEGEVVHTDGALAGSLWVVVPVVETGFVAVPDEIILTTEVCTSTSVGPTSSVPGSTLPFTGLDTGLMVGLGASALALGALLLFAVRREEA